MVRHAETAVRSTSFVCHTAVRLLREHGLQRFPDMRKADWLNDIRRASGWCVSCFGDAW